MEVEIKNLRFFRGAEEMLLIREWSLRSGEMYLLSGPTGCGKSTFAKWLTGWNPAYSVVKFGCGRIGADRFTDEKMFLSAFVKEYCPLYLLQDAYTIFNPYRSVGDHLRDIWKNQRKHSFFKSEEEFLEFLRRLGLNPSTSFLRRKAHQISQGEAQRIALILSLIRPSQLLIADEIFTNVDRKFSWQMIEVLEEWQKRTGALVLFISHDTRFFTPYIKGHFRVDGGELKTKKKANTHPAEKNIIAVPKVKENLFFIKNLLVPVANRQRREEILWSADEFYCGEGECLGISGLSGIGKTTFLLGLMGERSLEWEEVYVRGVAQERDRFLLPLDIRYLLQSVVSGFNPLQTIRSSLKEIQKVRKTNHEELDRLISDFGLGEDLLNKFPDQVSGGEIQRFGVLSLLMGQPDLILFDESFSSIDIRTRESIWKSILRQQAKKGFALIVVSHDEEWLRSVTDRWLRIENQELKTKDS